MKNVLLIGVLFMMLTACGNSAVSQDQLNKQLFEAVQKGQIELVRKSIDMGADINATDYRKKTPIFYAILNGFREIESYLQKKGAVIAEKERNGALSERFKRPGMIGSKEYPGTQFEKLPKDYKPNALGQLLKVHSRIKARESSIEKLKNSIKKSMEKELKSGDPAARKKLERIFSQLLVYYKDNPFEDGYEVNPEAGYLKGDGEITLMNLLADSLIFKRNRKENLFEDLIETYDRVRFNLNEKDFRLDSASVSIDTLKTLVSLRISQNAYEDAFEVSEKAKSAVFSEMMARRGAREQIAARDPEFKKYVDQEMAVFRKINEIKNKMKKASKADLRQLGYEVGDLFRKFEMHQLEVMRKFPRYSQLLSPRKIKLFQMQKLLRDDETYISYSLFEDYTMAFIVTNSTFKSLKLSVCRKDLSDERFQENKTNNIHRESVRNSIPISRKISPRDKKYKKQKSRKNISGRDKGKGIITQLRETIYATFNAIEPASKGERKRFSEIYKICNQYPELSKNFYKKIFEPLVPYIHTKKIIIAAEYELYGFPFEALITSIPEEVSPEDRKRSAIRVFRGRTKTPLFSEYSYMKYLGDRYSISYIPNASSLEILRGKLKPKRVDTEGLIAFANPTFPQRINVDDMWPPDPLPESSKEAESFKSQIGTGKIYIGSDATEANVWAAPLDKAKYILFSTHGYLAGKVGTETINEPVLVLSLVNNPKEYDGLFSMTEATGLLLNSDLVILSACESSGKNGKGGEGFAGLARSLLFAGSQAIVASHWKVDSRATRLLISNYGKHLKSKERLEALKASSTDVKNTVVTYGNERKVNVSYSHPYFWASFVLLGEQ